MLVCACVCLPCALQGLEIQPAFPVLAAHRGHAGLSKPQAGQARVQRNLWGPLPQLRPGAPARPLLPAQLRSGAGAIQRGKGRVECYVPCIRMGLISSVPFPSPPLFSSLPIVCPVRSQIYQLQLCMCSHIRHAIPPTCHKPWQAKFKRWSSSLAMPAFTSSAEIKVKSLTTAFGRHAQPHSSGVAPWWRNYFSSSLLWFLPSRAGPELGTAVLKNWRCVGINISDFLSLLK